MFILPSDTEMTPELLADYIKKHKALNIRYERLYKMYKGEHEILERQQKEKYKPDNRLVVNFAKYIVDTLNGFFIGIPIKATHESDEVSKYLEFIDSYNNQDDNNAELSKLCSIYGHGFELIYIDEKSEVGIIYVNPQEAFIVYDDSIRRNPLFGVRYYLNNKVLEGSYSDKKKIVYFTELNGEFVFQEEKSHVFGDVPLIEYVENEERIGAFENVETLINGYNKALSEKANDVDYYADAYLLILGAILDDETLRGLRDSRIINMSAEDTKSLVVQFLSKPESDTTQENLINRLEKLIFQISMVANINDENFGNATGVSLKYKLQSMNNLAKTKERKFTAGMNRRYKMIANLPTSKIGKDDWMGIECKFTRNIPANDLEESQIAGNLAGITSEETQLKVLSVVDNVKEEIERKEKEKELVANTLIRTGEVDEESGLLGGTSEEALGTA